MVTAWRNGFGKEAGETPGHSPASLPSRQPGQQHWEESEAQLPSQLCSSPGPVFLQLWPSGWPWAPRALEGEVGSAHGPG